MKSLALAIVFLYAFIQSAFCQVIVIPPATSYSGGYYYDSGNVINPLQYVPPKLEYSTPGIVIDFSPVEGVGTDTRKPQTKMVIEVILDWIMPTPGSK